MVPKKQRAKAKLIRIDISFSKNIDSLAVSDSLKI